MFLSPSSYHENDKGTRRSKPHGTNAFRNSASNTSAGTSMAKVSHMDKPRVVVEGSNKIAQKQGRGQNFARIVNNIIWILVLYLLPNVLF